MKVYVLADRQRVADLELGEEALELRFANDLRFLEVRNVVSGPGGKGPGAAYWSSFYILCPGDTWPESDAKFMAEMWDRDLYEYEWEDTIVLQAIQAAPEYG